MEESGVKLLSVFGKALSLFFSVWQGCNITWANFRNAMKIIFAG
jgi:hypothetical protein